MSLTTRVLIGLVLGFALGLVAMQIPALASVPGWIEPLGTISMSANEIPVRPQADDYRTGIKVVVVPARPR